MHRKIARRLAVLACVAMGLGAARASAGAAPGSLLAPGTLIWGADQEGGGPYVYPADDDPGRVVGFEVDIAAELAAALGVRAKFFQGPWDRMPELLRTKKCDVILNGYEWTAARLDVMQATVPYYVYQLQLLARAGGEVRAWADLELPSRSGPRTIGVLTGSAAEKYLRARLAGRAEIIGYDGSTEVMREVETGKLDATLQDTPTAIFYRSRFPALAAIGEPVGRGYYVAYVRKEQQELARALSGAFIDLIRRGELERIYRAYGLWNDAQAELRAIADASPFYGYPPVAEAQAGASRGGARGDAVPAVVGAVGAGPARVASGQPPGDLSGEPAAVATEAPGAASNGDVGPRSPVTLGARKRGLAVIVAYGSTLIQSAGLTLVLSCLSFPLAVAAGLFVALGRLYGPRWMRSPLTLYVEFLRGTPVMLQLYFIFFILPEIGINIPAFWTAILGLAVNYSAYESEIYRAGLLAVPRGQMEAALALGMSRPLALRRVVVPQAMRIVTPPVVNDFIALFKDTSVCSVVTLVELTKRFSVLSQSTQATTELMIMTAVLYLAMSYPLSLLSRRLELGRGTVPA